MKRNFNVIKIDGFKGLFFAGFAICCLVAGFLSFPGWVCMHVWNFVAGYFYQMPQMTMVHGVILWCIIALSAYALNKGDFSISFGSQRPIPGNEERLKEILRKISEEQTAFLKSYGEQTDRETNIETAVEKENEDKTVLK